MRLSDLMARVKKVGALPFLRGEKKAEWHEQNGVIYSSVTSNGRSGSEWIKISCKKKYNLGSYARRELYALNSTSNVTTKIAIVKGLVWDDKERSIENVLKFAIKRQLLIPSLEVACLIRAKFSDEEVGKMGLICPIVTMIGAVKNGKVPLFSTYSTCTGGLWETLDFTELRDRWGRHSGFAFICS